MDYSFCFSSPYGVSTIIIDLIKNLITVCKISIESCSILEVRSVQRLDYLYQKLRLSYQLLMRVQSSFSSLALVTRVGEHGL